MKTRSIEQLDRQQIKKSFAKAAESYDQVAHLQQWVADNLLERLTWLKMNPQTILDAGSGTGQLTRGLTQMYPQARVYALDFAWPMLREARRQQPRNWRQWGKKTGYWICGEVERLPLADESLDMIVSNLMLQWCNNVELVFKEFLRVLKPKGILLFSTLGPDTLQELRHSWAAVDQYSHVNQFIDMHDLGDSLLAQGFIDPVMDIDWVHYHYANVKDLLRDLKRLGAHNVTHDRLKGLTGKQHFNQMVNAYEKLRNENDLPVTYEVVYGHALGNQPQTHLSKEVKIPFVQRTG